jgi:hypothetical protein
MTTYQKIQEKTKEVEELEKQFNALHRKAKYFKKEKLHPMQQELKALWDRWKSEMKQITGMG